MSNEEIMMRKLNAFKLFKKEGKLDNVNKRYPDLVSFVELNRHKTFDQLKADLVKELYVHV